MPLTPGQLKELNNAPPPPSAKRAGASPTCPDPVAEANRIFGLEGWDRETLEIHCVRDEVLPNGCTSVYLARVRVRVRAGADGSVVRDASGFGYGSGAGSYEAHVAAVATAEAEATRRALSTFGPVFAAPPAGRPDAGSAGTKPRANGAARKLPWVVLSATGDDRGHHEDPAAFCAALRAGLESTADADELAALWTRNSGTIAALKTARPDLTSANGTHYADLLARLYARRKAILTRAAPDGDGASQVSGRNAEAAVPLRLVRRRDPEHLRFVASKPCLVCGRSPSQAHHLRFAQPRAMGKKVSDEWTVPLCTMHHRALHDIGDEEAWWRELGIDAAAEARRLWEDRSSNPHADAAAE